MLSKVNYLAKIFFLTMDILMSFIVDHHVDHHVNHHVDHHDHTCS